MELAREAECEVEGLCCLQTSRDIWGTVFQFFEYMCFEWYKQVKSSPLSATAKILLLGRIETMIQCSSACVYGLSQSLYALAHDITYSQ